MALAAERSVFERAHQAWADGDFETFMRCVTDDVLYTLNVDGQQVPYAMSALGRADLQDRLQLLLDTFEVKTFNVEWLVHEGEFSRSLVHGVYRHRRTGEILDVKVRFHGWVRDGLLMHVEEIHDARYVEAYERFVFHMMQAAQELGSS